MFFQIHESVITYISNEQSSIQFKERIKLRD